jgi:hypothetical protein
MKKMLIALAVGALALAAAPAHATTNLSDPFAYCPSRHPTARQQSPRQRG